MSHTASHTLTTTAAGTTTTGRRSNNEDAFLVDHTLGLYAVADGMGGYEGGELASRLALDEVHAFLRALHDDPEQTWPFAQDPALAPDENLVDQAIRLAHRSIVEARTPRTPKMGTTIAALVQTSPRTLVLAHVGDSRVYRWRAGAVTQLTRDHSMLEEMRAAGVIGSDDAAPHLRNYLTRALGVEGWSRPTITRLTAEAGDRYLLCTDGLSGVLDEAELGEHLAFASRQGAAERLVHAALARGSTDNVTAVVLGVA